MDPNTRNPDNQDEYELKDLIRDGIKYYNVKDFLRTKAFKSSVIVAIIFTILVTVSEIFTIGDIDINKLLESFLPLSLQITLTLASLSITGIVILVSTDVDDVFVKFIYKNKLYNSVLFLFAEPLLFVIINLFSATISLFVVYTIASLHWIIPIGLVFINGFLFLYTTLSLLLLYNVYAMYGRERLHYNKSIENEGKSELKEKDQIIIDLRF